MVEKEIASQARNRGLRWNGKGFQYHIPARDLTEEEVEKYGGVKALLKTGIYELVEQPEKKPKAKAVEED